MKQGQKGFSHRITIALLAIQLGACNSAFASYDSFLFGKDEKIELWPEALQQGDVAVESAPQKFLNQAIVDQYLADTFVPESKKIATKLNHSSIAQLNLVNQSQSRTSALRRRQLALQILLLISGGQVKEAKQVLSMLLPKHNSPAAEKPAVFSSNQWQEAAASLERSGDIISSDYLRKARSYIRESTKMTKPDSPAEQKYSEGLEALGAGRLEEAQKKFKQALDLHDRNSMAKFDARLALGQSLLGLDRRAEAQEHFNLVIEDLKRLPLPERPQTEALLSQYLAIIEVDLANLDDLSGGKKETVLHGLNSLVAAAYLCKIDGRHAQAAHLFRRAYLITKKYFSQPAENMDDQLSSICYDLGETLFWSGAFSEAEHYMQEALTLREKKGKESNEALDTRSTLGRVLINGNRGEVALRFYLETLQLLAAKSFAGNLDTAKQLRLEDLVYQLSQQALAPGNKLNPAFKRQCDDAFQGVADAAISCKQYDLATTSDIALLAMRENGIAPNTADREQIVATLWQLAWVAQMSGSSKLATSNSYYSRLIKDFPSRLPRPLADWYHARAVNSDMLGHYDCATRDFRRARLLFKKHLRKEHDTEQIDIVKWTIDDINYNLASRQKSPASDPDYLKAEPNSYWKRGRMPLKVFVDDSLNSGFGGDIRALMLKAMAQWTDFQDSPIKLVYVDHLNDADVYIERVTSYDDIPYSSAGRTSVIYEKNNARVLDRAHVRVYCPSFDGEAGGGQSIESQQMSTFARTQLYTLFMHEFGHVIGVGHSPGGQDVMYWKSCSEKLSGRDMESIRKLYREEQR